MQVSDVNQLIKKFNETKKMIRKMMPAFEEAGGGRGKKGKKKKKRGARGFMGGSGMRMSDLRKIQNMIDSQ